MYRMSLSPSKQNLWHIIEQLKELKIQKIYKQENETLCQQTSRVVDQVRALGQKQQAPKGNQGSILDFIRTELDEKIDKLTKALPDISSFVTELFTLGRGTNTLPATQSALCRETKKGEATTDDVSVGDANKSAEVKHRSLG